MDIELQRISKAFREKQVLSDFSLKLPAGSFTVLTGASGSGKTTLLHILMGLLPPDAGSVTPGVRFGVVFQENRLLPGRNAVENLLFALPGMAEKASVSRLLAELLPPDSLTQPVEELSGGMQRRVAIARALAAPSDCVVMDEPFTGLDAETAQTVIAFIFRHLQGRTLLLSTHQPALVAAYAPAVITLDAH